MTVTTFGEKCGLFEPNSWPRVCVHVGGIALNLSRFPWQSALLQEVHPASFLGRDGNKKHCRDAGIRLHRSDSALGLLTRDGCPLLSILTVVLRIWKLTGLYMNVAGAMNRTQEFLYWMAILVSNTLGMALRDFLANSLEWGFAVTAGLIGGILVRIAAAKKNVEIDDTEKNVEIDV
eukprot:scaffold28485_cov58-Attheya_sp.AAC.2